jgi:hypothetical protein
VALEDLRRVAQRRVARGMAVGVVELLEVIDVEEQQREGAVQAPGARDRLAQELAELAAVVEAREAVTDRMLRMRGAEASKAPRRPVSTTAPSVCCCARSGRASSDSARPQPSSSTSRGIGSLRPATSSSRNASCAESSTQLAQVRSVTATSRPSKAVTHP